MMSLINRDKLIERIKKEIKFANIILEGLGEELNRKFWEGVILEKEDTIKRLEQEPTVNRWMPCAEMLPKKDGKYLCYVGDGNYAIGTYTKICGWMFGTYVEEVIAWQPLPPKYEE